VRRVFTALITAGVVAVVAGILATVGMFAGDTAHAQSAKTRLTDPEEAVRFNDISDQLMCQCGCQMVLRICNHQNCPSALPMRAQVEKDIGAGRSDDEIVQAFVNEHGLKVLSSPPTEGFNLAAWVMPGFALFVGLMIVVYFVRDFARRRQTAIVGGPAADIDPELRSRIERELETLER